MLDFSEQEAAALVALQRGVALTERPFAETGALCGLSEEAVLALVRRLLASGEARRFGAVFDTRRLGYRSALCAMTVPRVRLADVAEKVSAVRGVTHAYERGWPEELPRDLPGGPGDRSWPNLWFTLAAPGADFADELQRLRTACQPYGIHELPATRRFKIDVVFDLRTRDRDERVESRLPPVRGESTCTVALVKGSCDCAHASGDVPVSARIYKDAAEQLDMTEETFSNGSVIADVRRAASFRTIATPPQDQFKANGMCWDMPGGRGGGGRAPGGGIPGGHPLRKTAHGHLFPSGSTPDPYVRWLKTQQLYERLT